MIKKVLLATNYLAWCLHTLQSQTSSEIFINMNNRWAVCVIWTGIALVVLAGEPSRWNLTKFCITKHFLSMSVFNLMDICPAHAHFQSRFGVPLRKLDRWR